MVSKRKRRRAKFFRILGWGTSGFFAVSVLMVLPWRWIDPPVSSFMVQHRIMAQIQARERPSLRHEWVDWEQISPNIKLAVLAAEDQRFVRHRGFDLVEMERAWERHRAGGRLRGASTISQQTAKNLFLWPGRDPFRKALEAWLTFLMETFWSKQRILEVYLNIAQFSPDTFGVGAASWRYFDRPAAALRVSDAALLAAVLPNPNLYRLEAPTPALQRRAVWIQRQMRQLGGTDYLRSL